MIKRYIRYIRYLARYLILELPRGLDFTMRNKTIGITRKDSHGYALSPEVVVNNMLNSLNISKQDSFIDIGSGKGGVPVFASKYNFGRVAGLEIEEFLHNIAKKNVKILSLENRIELFLEDAILFNKYHEFNIFYLFNPFELNVYKEVLDKIFESIHNPERLNSNIVLICYGASDYDYIKKSSLFNLIRDDKDNVRDSKINIWKIKDEIAK
jgi:16S rRNA G966 N2-methylase RsmD